MITSLTCLRLIRVLVGTEDRDSERTWTLQQLLAGLAGFRVLEELVLEHTELFIAAASEDEIGAAMRIVSAVGSSLRRLRFTGVFLASEHLQCFTRLGGLEELQLRTIRFRPNIINQFDFVRHLPRLSKFELCDLTKVEVGGGYCFQSRCILDSLSASTSLRHLTVDLHWCEETLALSALTALTFLELKLRHYTGGSDSSLAPIRALTSLQVLVLDPVRDLPPFVLEVEQDPPLHIPLCDSLSLLAGLPRLQSLKVVMKGLHHGWDSDGDESEGEEEESESDGVLDLAGVAMLTRLTSLTLGIRMDRHSLSPLTALTSLRRLAFLGGEGCHLGSADLREVGGMGSLEEVDLRECRVERDGLRWLALLPRLQHVRVVDELEEDAREILLCTR